MEPKFPRLRLLDADKAWEQRNAIFSDFLRQNFAHSASPISILEAGCGREWHLEMGDLTIHLTGVDMEKEALDARSKQAGDLQRAIQGDLREIDFKPGEFDVVYSCDVLEHIKGAEEVLDRLFFWLKPGGVAILVFPDRETLFGSATRFSPHWVHVAYHKYVLGYKNAGRAGFAPYPTYYDPVVSRRGIRRYCREHGHRIALEYGRPPPLLSWPKWMRISYAMVGKVISALSNSSISYSHIGLAYVIEKDAT